MILYFLFDFGETVFFCDSMRPEWSLFCLSRLKIDQGHLQAPYHARGLKFAAFVKLLPIIAHNFVSIRDLNINVFAVISVIGVKNNTDVFSCDFPAALSLLV